MQTESQFKLWRELQLVGIELIERNWPTTAAYVRLGVALGEAIQRGLATDVDYNNFERLHPVITRRNRVDRPCWKTLTEEVNEMNYTTRLYERDEKGKFWPAGKFTFDTRKRASASLSYHVCEGIAGIVTTTGWISEYRGMSEDEALRVSPVKFLALGR